MAGRRGRAVRRVRHRNDLRATTTSAARRSNALVDRHGPRGRPGRAPGSGPVSDGGPESSENHGAPCVTCGQRDWLRAGACCRHGRACAAGALLGVALSRVSDPRLARERPYGPRVRQRQTQRQRGADRSHSRSPRRARSQDATRQELAPPQHDRVSRGRCEHDEETRAFRDGDAGVRSFPRKSHERPAQDTRPADRGSAR